MSFEIYHQLGHNDVWNFESLREDGTGDGVILSPKNKQQSLIETQLDKELGTLKGASFFDPQFFFPRFTGAESETLRTYDFFPISIKTVGTKKVKNSDGEEVIKEVREGKFMAKNFTPEKIKECVDFQFRNNLRYYVIPTEHLKEQDTLGFLERQEEKYVIPFRDAIRKVNASAQKTMLLQLALCKEKIMDSAARIDILSWAMKFMGVRGIYLIVSSPAKPAQIKDPDFLSAYLAFVSELAKRGFKVVLGYLGTEAIILSLASPSIVTMGSFTTTRRFTTAKKSQGGGPEKPRPRIYLPKLLQWVHGSYLPDIESKVSNMDDFLEVSKHREATNLRTLDKVNAFRFSCLAFYNQLDKLRKKDVKERCTEVRSMIENAMKLYSTLGELGKDSDGSHLQTWLDVVDGFA